MKKLILFLLMIPLFSLSQVSSWRSQGQQNGGSSRPSTPSYQAPSYQPPRNIDNNSSRWRNQPQTPIYKGPSRPRVVYPNYYNPWNPYPWGWNRWNGFGAPLMGWDYYYPGYYNNNWGYREPQRIYVYENGRRDTIKGKKTHASFGISLTTKQELGGWLTIGNRGYFIGEYVSTYARDNSSFFPNGRLQNIDFPLVDDLVKRNMLYLGVGKKIKRTGFHTMIGFGRETIRFRGRDDIGYITFPKSEENFATIKLGLIHDFQKSSVKLDYDPIRGGVSFGLGVNF